MYDRLGKVYYSMVYRLGQMFNGRPNYDCSSSVYLSLKQGGFLPADFRVGNTDTLFGDLERNGWVRLYSDANDYVATQRGDVFIWGRRGVSGGAAGHTGVFVDADNIIHCSSGYNGIHVDNHDWLSRINGSPELTVYRYVGTVVPSGSPTDQIVEKGSYIRFDKRFRVDELQEINGIWQVRTNELCPVDFSWDDNGIPVAPLYEVDGDGYATGDQDLHEGSLYVIPGKFEVLDLFQGSDSWFALIDSNGLKFWIDLAAATEAPKSDPGTPIPQKRTPLPTPGDGQPKPNEPDPPETPNAGSSEEPPKEDPKPPVNNNPKEDNMAFTKAEQAELAIASKNAEDFANYVAQSEQVQEITSGFSKKVKTTVYIVADSAVVFGMLLPSLAIAFNVHVDLAQVTAASDVLLKAGGGALVMFGLLKTMKKQ